MKKFIRIGVDLAKNYFQVHALASEVGPARKLRRSKMHEFFSQIEPSLIGMEACGSADYWALNSRPWVTKYSSCRLKRRRSGNETLGQLHGRAG